MRDTKDLDNKVIFSCNPKNNRVQCLSELVLSASVGESEDIKLEAPKKIQLLRTISFKDPRYGDVKIKKEHLSEMVKNFKDNVRGVDLAIDYSHDSWAEAAGWVKDVYTENEGKELWLDVKWTPKGAKKLIDGEFRYLSAEFDTAYTDGENGKSFGYVLLGGGLTNRPAVKKMKPTTKLTEAEKKMEEIKKLQEKNESLEKSIVELSKTNKTLGEENKSLKDEVKKLNDEKLNDEKVAYLNELLSEKKIVPAQKDALMTLSIDNIKGIFKDAKAIELNEKEQGSSKEPKVQTEETLLGEAKTLSAEKNIELEEAISELLKTDKFKNLNKE